jgi:surface antigen
MKSRQYGLGIVTVLGLAAAVIPSTAAIASSPHHAAAKSCTTAATKRSRFNTTPKGAGPWHVPLDPCNSEGSGLRSTPYSNCAYWAAEKRPDVWRRAVLKYGYPKAPGGAWNVELDAKRAHFPINHRPKVGDLGAWPPGATMGTTKTGVTRFASPGGHVAYVEKVRKHRSITLSSMGIGSSPSGGYTFTIRFNKAESFFIHDR